MKETSLKTSMIRRARPFGALALGLLVAGAAAAQTSPPPTSLPPVNVTASATVHAPMSATLGGNLSFGSFTADAANAGTVIIDASTGARTASGGASLLNSGTSRGQINLVGAPGASYQVALAGPVDLVAAGSAEKMVLTPTHSVTGTNGSAVLNNSGTGVFYIGGELAVAKGQAPGTYTGLVAVTVSYP